MHTRGTSLVRNALGPSENDLIREVRGGKFGFFKLLFSILSMENRLRKVPLKFVGIAT